MSETPPLGPITPKQSSVKRTLWNVAAVVLAGILVFVLARAADWHAVAEQVRRAKVPLLLACIALGSLACLLRAVRWYVMLSGQKRVSFWPVFWANSSGNFCNSILPARAGEFIRAAMVSAKTGLSKRFVLAVALCERTFDLLVLVTLTRIGATFVPGISLPIQRAIHLAFWLAIGAAAILAIIVRGHKLLNLGPGQWEHWPAVARRGWSHLRPFVEGIQSIHNRKRLLLFVALTVPVWLLDGWGARLAAGALGFDLPLSVALLLLAALGCSSLLPTTPGQLGVFQFVTVRVLAVANITYNQALAYGLILQAGTYVALGLWGVPGLWMYKKSRSDRSSSLDTAATPDNAHPLISR